MLIVFYRVINIYDPVFSTCVFSSKNFPCTTGIQQLRFCLSRIWEEHLGHIKSLGVRFPFIRIRLYLHFPLVQVKRYFGISRETPWDGVVLIGYGDSSDTLSRTGEVSTGTSDFRGRGVEDRDFFVPLALGLELFVAGRQDWTCLAALSGSDLIFILCRC